MKTLQTNRWVLIAEGALFIVLGLFCLLNPIFASGGFINLLSFALVIGGGFQLFRSFVFRNKIKLLIFSVLASFAAILTGLLIYNHGKESLMLISCLMIAYFCFDGISRIFFSTVFHETDSWYWVMFSGFLSLFLGLVLMMKLPVSTIYTIGIVLGVSMLTFGFSFLATGIHVKTGKY